MHEQRTQKDIFEFQLFGSCHSYEKILLVRLRMQLTSKRVALAPKNFVHTDPATSTGDLLHLPSNNSLAVLPTLGVPQPQLWHLGWQAALPGHLHYQLAVSVLEECNAVEICGNPE